MAAPLLIADTPWLLYRSFFALPRSITDARGRPVNALLGTVNAILAVLDARSRAGGMRAVAMCMGAEQADYRVELYPPYHAHRDPMPKELAAQWEKAPELLTSLGWSVIATDSFEADDVMLSLARAEQRARGEALLLTADRDLYGAVGKRVRVLELGKGGAVGEIDAAEVKRRYGVPPELVPDFIALRGDPSDGLPGAPGVGAKTAAELLRAHGSLEAAIEAADAHVRRGAIAASGMRPRTAAALAENAPLLQSFKRIATLQEIPVERPPDGVTDFGAGAEAARGLGMRRLGERLDVMAAAKARRG